MGWVTLLIFKMQYTLEETSRHQRQVVTNHILRCYSALPPAHEIHRLGRTLVNLQGPVEAKRG